MQKSDTQSFLSRIWSNELPVFKKRHAVPAALFMFFLGSSMAISLLLNLHTDALFLGPGLGMEAGTEPFWQFVEYLNNIYGGLGFLLIIMALFSSSFIVIYSAIGYFNYKKVFGNDYPLRELITFPTIAIIERLLFAISVALLGLGAWLLGYDFNDGLNLIVNWAIATNDWIISTVPTLIELPYIAAFFVAYGLAGFVHYWLHRISHERRFFWLLFHRFHHMPTVMFSASVPPVFFSVPLFIFVVIPYHLAFGALTKLFCDEPLYFALIIYKLFYYIPDVWAHSTALFEKGRKNPLIRWMSFFLSNGIYHYVHHSSEKMDGNPTNMVNLGGSFLYLPDILFGTFKPIPEKVPPVGLTGNPPLFYNPLRLAFSGMAQVAYELWHNRNIKDWFWILFGSVEYVPTNSKDYALKDGAENLSKRLI